MIRFDALRELRRAVVYRGSHRTARSQLSTMDQVRAIAATAVSIAANIDVLTMRVHTCARPPVVTLVPTPAVELAPPPRKPTSIRDKMRQRARIAPLPRIGAVA